MKSKELSTPHAIYDMLPDFEGQEFTLNDILARIPWSTTRRVSAALWSLADFGTIEKVGVGRGLKGKRCNVYRVADLGAEKKWASAHAEGLHREYKGGKRPRKKQPGRPVMTTGHFKTKVNSIIDRLVALAVELEDLGIEDFSELELHREMKRRKK